MSGYSSYSNDDFDRFMYTHDDRSMVVYVHGACENNGQSDAAAGIGIYWGPGNSYNRSEPLNSRPQTSNRAALVAARCAILDALDYNFTDSLIVRSNNLYLVKTMNEYVHDYVRNGFYRRDGHPAKNPEDIEKLYDCSYRSGINVGYEFRPTHISTRRARELSYDGIWADN